MDLIALAVPFFLLAIIVELIVNWRRKTDYYRSNDAINSISAGMLDTTLGYFTKFLPLLKISAKDVTLRPAAPSGYPGAWGSRKRWSGDEVSPFERMRVLNPSPSEKVRRRLHQRLPARLPWLAEAGIAELWAGMIDVTPDAVPYICEAPSPGGLFIGTVTFLEGEVGLFVGAETFSFGGGLGGDGLGFASGGEVGVGKGLGFGRGADEDFGGAGE